MERMFAGTTTRPGNRYERLGPKADGIIRWVDDSVVVDR